MRLRWCARGRVDTGRALANRAENETSPLIKRSNVESHAVPRRWIHTLMQREGEGGREGEGEGGKEREEKRQR